MINRHIANIPAGLSDFGRGEANDTLLLIWTNYRQAMEQARGNDDVSIAWKRQAIHARQMVRLAIFTIRENIHEGIY